MRNRVRAIYSFGQAEELYLETGARSAWALDSGSGSIPLFTISHELLKANTATTGFRYQSA